MTRDTLTRSAGIGDELASARAVLARRLEEARDVVRAVMADPLYSSNDPKVAPDALWIDNGCSLVEDAELLRRVFLDSFKAMVFNGQESVKLAVGGNRLNRVSRRLCEAAEQVAALSRSIVELGNDLARQYSSDRREDCERAAVALLVLSDWDAASRSLLGRFCMSDDYGRIAAHILESLARDGMVRLTFFVCPPVDFTHLSGDRPERYLRSEMRGSVLSRLADRLRDLFRGLEGAQVDFEVLALIGDTDEEDYLRLGVPQLAKIDRAVLETQREGLVRCVSAYLTAPVGTEGSSHPRVLPAHAVRVARLSAMAPSRIARDIYASVVEAPDRYFDQQDIDSERAIMRDLWCPGSYYNGLEVPDDATLTRIVIHKFASYAMQGVLLAEHYPHVILVQTERPSLLRAKMFNAGRRELGLSTLAVVQYFEPEPRSG